MSEFLSFNYELSDSEVVDCIDTAAGIAIKLFGSINRTSLKDTTERLLQDGRYARISRLVSTEYGMCDGIVINCQVFHANGEPEILYDEEEVTVEDEDTGKIDYVIDDEPDNDSNSRVYEGTITGLYMDSKRNLFSTTHGIGRLTVDCFGEVELDFMQITDMPNPDPIIKGAKPCMGDQLMLSELEAIIVDTGKI
jgi:hypothetical protein